MEQFGEKNTEINHPSIRNIPHVTIFEDFGDLKVAVNEVNKRQANKEFIILNMADYQCDALGDPLKPGRVKTEVSGKFMELNTDEHRGIFIVQVLHLAEAIKNRRIHEQVSNSQMSEDTKQSISFANIASKVIEISRMDRLDISEISN